METTTVRPPAPAAAPTPPDRIERVHVVATPGTCGGKPRIAGTRIPVKHVVIMHEHQGMTLAEISEGYPHLTRADLHAALAYYHDQKEEMDQEISEDQEWSDRMRAENPSRIRDLLRERAAHAPIDPIPPG